MAATKRKRQSFDASKPSINENIPPLKKRASARHATTKAAMNPDVNGEIIDGPDATRASPDSDVNQEIVPGLVKQEDGIDDEVTLKARKPGRRKKVKVEDAEAVAGTTTIEEPTFSGPAITNSVGEQKAKKGRKAVQKTESKDVQPPAAPIGKPEKRANGEAEDPEADGVEEADEEEVKDALSRPPPVNSDYLPLPWRGRLGFACLNTYLRSSNPPVFSSRTCRIQSILEHRHPLQDPNQPEHPTKNRPDKDKPADVELGKRYVESLCLANVKDIAKMIRWNDKYNIKFLRLSSEMFPFASHPEYGYKLAPFASEALAEAGKVIAQFGHRVTTHPGQFTQLGSPRKPVIDNAIRDLEYHDELLSLLKLPEQQDRDAVMILHMGGMFEGKIETIQRFRENYKNLPQGVKNRLVLENDDMGWSVHDLLPVCEELNIPMVLDFHHHNIVFDSSQIREGTKDIIDLFPRIKATWGRKGIKQKMHYSEPTPAAITPRQRRKHNPRVATLPPCPPDMDLMIEAKDKEQAVFELMRTFKLPGYERLNDIIPYVRNDDNKVALASIAKKSRSKKKPADSDEQPPPDLVPDEEVGMGGVDGRVYWPPGMEEWLRPKKREVKPKTTSGKDPSQVKKEAAEAYAAREAAKKAQANGTNSDSLDEDDEDVDATPATKKAKAAMRKAEKARKAKAAATSAGGVVKEKKPQRRSAKKISSVPTPPSDESEELVLSGEDEVPIVPAGKRSGGDSRKGNSRAAKKRTSYLEEDGMEMEET